MTSVATVIAMVGAACLWPTEQEAVQDPAALVSPQAPIDRAVPITGDTYLRQGEPNQNFGTAAILRVRPTGDNRALLRVNSKQKTAYEIGYSDWSSACALPISARISFAIWPGVRW